MEQRFHWRQTVERFLSSVHRTALLLSFRQLISVSIFFSVNDFIELYESDSSAVATVMRVALHCERTTIIFQLFGVNESAAPCDMENYFEYK
jgi:hypothetical protein